MTKCTFDLRQAEVTSQLAPKGGGWRSLGSDPFFELQDIPDIQQGWYRISVGIASDKPFYPRLYFDFGNGFNELESAKLFKTGRSRFSVTTMLRHAPRRIRLDPTDEQGSFEITKLRLKRLNKAHFGVFAGVKAAKLFMQGPVQNFDRMVRSGKSLVQGRHFFSINPNVSPRNDGDRYTLWRETFDYHSSHDRLEIEAELADLAAPPIVSLIMPVVDPDPALLNEAITSVTDQLYQNWELCLATDISCPKRTQEKLKNWADRDARIKLTHSETAGLYSTRCNAALSVSTGEWIARLDPEDQLAPHALATLVLTARDRPDGDIFYSDEDRINSNGRRSEPHFKPDFSPELFRSMNYLSHLTMYRLRHVRGVGGWSDKHPGSEEYDLTLRIWDHVARDEAIVHIPKVLYHNRKAGDPTRSPFDLLGRTLGAGNSIEAVHAVQDHIERRGMAAEVLPMENRPCLRVKPALPERLPKVSFIIPTRDRADLVKNCILSICEQDEYPNFEILLIDNNSTDPDALRYFDNLNEDGIARVIKYPHPFNYSAINNWAVSQSDGEILALINNDIAAISSGWISEMVGWAIQDRVGCVGARLLYPDNTIQHAGVILGIGGLVGHGHRSLDRDEDGYFYRPNVVQNLSALTAACLFVRRDVYNKVGGLDEVDLKVAFNDVDFCLRVRQAGYLNVYTPFAELYHFESTTRGAEDDPAKVARFNSEIDTLVRRWGPELAKDPYYSPNLTLGGEDFAIRIDR